jgi:hypothetical protein
MNPNIIPHPLQDKTWVIVAQHRRNPDEPGVAASELVCNAVFVDDVLQCAGSPSTLPIAPTTGDNCEGDFAFLAFNVGPHDARVFYGPKMAYTLYGSNSMFTCFGQWMQDFSVLTDWGLSLSAQEDFTNGTELQRPLPYSPVEKNWFVFWDMDNQIYAHYDVAPKRVFAKLGADGSAGEDLAPLSAENDESCMQRFMPKPGPVLESVHQATNSLSITMCKRSDPSCKPDVSNTFAFILFQHKAYFNFHATYEPYVMVFRRTAPFEIHGISQNPIWIHGREKKDNNETEMFYVTSMSWKARGQKYQGYLDDVVFLAFGIEDEKSGGIDLLAADLVMGLGMCSGEPGSIYTKL